MKNPTLYVLSENGLTWKIVVEVNSKSVSFSNVKFYDSELDQLVSGCYLSQVVDGSYEMDSGVPEWTIDDATMTKIAGWLKTI